MCGCNGFQVRVLCDGGVCAYQVSGFTVEREGYGSIRWLVPVDVRGLKLDDIISIIHGKTHIHTHTHTANLDSQTLVDVSVQQSPRHILASSCSLSQPKGIRSEANEQCCRARGKGIADDSCGCVCVYR